MQAVNLTEKALMRLIQELRLDRSDLSDFTSPYKPCCMCKALERPNYKTSAGLVKTSTDRGPWADRYLCEACFSIVCQRYPIAVEVIEPLDPNAKKLDHAFEIVQRFGAGTAKELTVRAKRAGIEVPENFYQYLFGLAQRDKVHRWKANGVWVYSLSPAPEGAIEAEIPSNRQKAFNFLRQFGDGVTAQELKKKVLEAGETLNFDLGAALSALALPETRMNKLIAKRTVTGINRYYLPETQESQRHAS